jgi:hypothetical protein
MRRFGAQCVVMWVRSGRCALRAAEKVDDRNREREGYALVWGLGIGRKGIREYLLMADWYSERCAGRKVMECRGG